ncbi:MAG TPA: DNA polymerase III subunit gamma/tau [Candidatus Dojkabacteria bacterium]|nr:DNA polymerase III subunit gamma/tau [Candidatus Dojkabacteria bacterium]
MSKSLYNKYRSQTFDELVGQESVTKLLKNAVKKGKIANAYLLVGSRGTGKTSTARILAKALNCSHLTEEGNPCNECDHCMAISKGSFLDLIEIDAASNRGIDQIRELKEKLEFSPSEGRFKIYIIDEVHMLTKEAFNALLKTLEEPPAHVVFILATTDVHKLPPTILSRCQRYDFKLGTDEQIRKVIVRSAKAEKVEFEEVALDVLVNNAKGSYRDAMSLLDVVVSGQMQSDKPEIITESEVRSILGMTSDAFVDSFVKALLSGDVKQSLELIYQVEKDGINLAQFVKQLLERMRKVLVAKVSGGDFPGFEAFSLASINKVISDFITLDRSIKFSSFPILSFELLIAQYAQTGITTPTNVSEPKREVVAKVTPMASVKKEAPAKPAVKVEAPSKVQEDDTIEEEEPSNSASEVEADMPASSGGPLDFALLKEKWTNIIQIIQSNNGPLAAILKNSQLLNLEGNTMNLQVPFEFYKDRVEDSKSKELISGAIKDLFGSSVKIACIVNGSVKKKKQVSADFILANVPAKEDAPKKESSSAKPPVNKKVEEIFAGM